MKRGVIFLSVVVALYGCSNQKAPVSETESIPVTQVTGIGKIIPEGGITGLASPVSGIVASIPVNEGSKVKKGDGIVLLDNTDQLLAAREADNKISIQQKAVESQQWLVEQKKTDIAEKLRKLSDAQELFESNATSGENVRNLQNDVDMANLEMKKLESDLASQQSQLKEAFIQREIKRNNLEQTILRSPIDGVVLDILPKTGEAVSQYQTYASIAPETGLIVNAEFDELFASKLASGQSCKVYLPGDSIAVAEGNVIRVSDDLKKKSLFSENGEEMEDRRVREAEISLDTVSGELLINTKVECIVQVK
ncbi:MAG TPA: HlyD family efflux transporter periplasmic adaptor subunit [Bacteroidales bacterium]|nr:HlyD family efflux transporter periplasmic adaptor subunit [Bacteroidales bacterium]